MFSEAQGDLIHFPVAYMDIEPLLELEIGSSTTEAQVWCRQSFRLSANIF